MLSSVVRHSIYNSFFTINIMDKTTETTLQQTVIDSVKTASIPLGVGFVLAGDSIVGAGCILFGVVLNWIKYAGR